MNPIYGTSLIVYPQWLWVFPRHHGNDDGDETFGACDAICEPDKGIVNSDTSKTAYADRNLGALAIDSLEQRVKIFTKRQT